MNNEKESRSKQIRWRNRAGRRVAIASLSLLALGGGVAVVTQPASASQAPTAAKSVIATRPSGAAMMSAGWGG